jgi:hypothetical protein
VDLRLLEDGAIELGCILGMVVVPKKGGNPLHLHGQALSNEMLQGAVGLPDLTANSPTMQAQESSYSHNG